ncbi:hypothetical protein PR048_012622 [Dryococelus australis]|uniref:Transposase n=1 Tax=Dryococelus australis TaxID=614101 RepID=A0ABQ9HPW9_9NEOP|nr:hypothetical protein PR048_012622 [Dryococelus australis]
MRKSWAEGTDYRELLREHNNAPITGLNVSPAQILFSRQVKTPAAMSLAPLKPIVQEGIYEALLAKKKCRSGSKEKATEKLEELRLSMILAAVTIGENNLARQLAIVVGTSERTAVHEVDAYPWLRATPAGERDQGTARLINPRGWSDPRSACLQMLEQHLEHRSSQSSSVRVGSRQGFGKPSFNTTSPLHEPRWRSSGETKAVSENALVDQKESETLLDAEDYLIPKEGTPAATDEHRYEVSATVHREQVQATAMENIHIVVNQPEKLLTFCGEATEKVTDFLEHAISEVNGWNDQEKCRRIKIHVKGAVKHAIENLLFREIPCPRWSVDRVSAAATLCSCRGCLHQENRGIVAGTSERRAVHKVDACPWLRATPRRRA